jgi:2'-5' RNA ligase
MTEQRYNIVLLPPESAYPVYQTYAQDLLKDLNGTYLLGPKSLPHITLCQFNCADPNLLKTVQEVCTSLNIPPYTPRFSGLSIAADVKEMPDLYWIGLNAIREAFLVSTHLQVRRMLERLGLACINSQGEEYRPHLTLANAYLKFPFSLAKSPNHLLGETKHMFKLTLGLSDNWGQFMQILK